jgi:hypothetical protein
MTAIKAMARTDAATSQHARIRVTVVGGLSGATAQWSRAGDAIGVELEHHDGRPGGRGSHAIVAAVRRAHLVVIITDPNSHGGVAVARRAAIAAARPHLLVKHLRPQGLRAVITDALAASGVAQIRP